MIGWQDEDDIFCLKGRNLIFSDTLDVKPWSCNSMCPENPLTLMIEVNDDKTFIFVCLYELRNQCA